MQTRRELATARGELNRMINFALLVIGAFAFAILQNDKALIALKNPISFVPIVGALIVISVLFWFRRALLQDMGNRWHVLRRLIQRHFPEELGSELLETIVIASSKRGRYANVNFSLLVCAHFLPKSRSKSDECVINYPKCYKELPEMSKCRFSVIMFTAI